MAAQIIYNSITVSLVIGRGGMTIVPTQERNEAMSASGKIETVNLYGIQEISLDAYFTEAGFFALFAWWAWARQGKEFAVAYDSTKTVNTTLDGAAAAGQKTIPLTATTGLAANDFCLIKAIDNDDEFEIVKIASISAGVSITATDNLIYTYASADVFRHYRYFPAVVSTEKEFRPALTGVKAITNRKYYHHTFRFIESL